MIFYAINQNYLLERYKTLQTINHYASKNANDLTAFVNHYKVDYKFTDFNYDDFSKWKPFDFSTYNYSSKAFVYSGILEHLMNIQYPDVVKDILDNFLIRDTLKEDAIINSFKNGNSSVSVSVRV